MPKLVAPLNANLYQVNGLGVTSNPMDAANRNYVDGRRLDQMVAPTASVNFGGQRQTSVADPVSPADGATKSYVDKTASRAFSMAVS
jgi:hypothetical protein